MSFHPNQQIFTCTTVNLRVAPGYLGETPPAVVAPLPERTPCTVTGPATQADDLTWWPVRVTLADGRPMTGWAAESTRYGRLLAAELAGPQMPSVAPPVPVAPKAASRNRLGFYIQSSSNEWGLWDAIGRVQPPVMLFHSDAANDMLLKEIRDFRAPNAWIVGRFYVTNDEQRAMLESGDPEGQGRSFAERILTYDFAKFTRRSSSGRLFIDAWMGLNECLPGPASDSYREHPDTFHRLYDAYDRFQLAFHDRLAQEGIESVAFNFAAGNFSQAAHYTDFFPRTLAACTYLGFHEYGWPSLIPGDGVHTGAGLYRQVLNNARRGDGSRHRIIITEAGLTRAYGHAQNPDVGWLNANETLDENRYWESLAWYNTLLDQDDVVGACLYQVGHQGDWATFRHLGPDNQGRGLHLVDRIVALGEQMQGAARDMAGAERSGLPTDRVTLTGQVTLDDRPVAGAVVRLMGDLSMLGGVRGAVVDVPGALTWSRRVTGFAGTPRTAWDRFVAGHVAGLTWSDYKRQLFIANPGLARTKGHFQANQSYFLPENAHVTPAFVWDRSLSGYAGTVRQLWIDWVQGKVMGMDYAAFRRQFLAYNSTVGQNSGQNGGQLTAEQTYLLPRTAQADHLFLSAVTTRRGRFRFTHIPAGRYTLTVQAVGAQPLSASLRVTDGLDIEAVLDPLLAASADGETRGGGDGQFMGTAGREFVVNGRVFRFIGVNLRGLVWYGSGHTLPASTSGYRGESLDRTREMGARVVRVFLPSHKGSTQETIERLGQALALAGDRGLYILPAFVNYYSDTEFYLPGDLYLYEKLDPNFNGNLLGGAFFRDRYQDHYLPFVRAVVDAFKDDPRIFAWEVGNELKYEPAWQDNDRAAFIGFMHTVAREIKRVDRNHLVATGMISASHASLNQGDLWRKLYGGPEFDFLTVHCYNEQYEGKLDHDYAARLNKPFIVEEAGFDEEKPGDRVELTRNDMARWFGHGASGYMPWGFMPTSADMQDGDKKCGMDRIWHGHDFDGLFNLYREQAAALKTQADQISPPAQTVVASPATQTVVAPPLDLSAFRVGQVVYAQTNLWVRRTPGHVGKDGQDSLVLLDPGDAITILGPSQVCDGLIWWPVRHTHATGADVGWSAHANDNTQLLATQRPLAQTRGAVGPVPG